MIDRTTAPPSTIVRRARIRLTIVYIGLFAVVLAVFSVVFYLAFALVLQPAFDIAPELSNTQAAELAYQQSIARIAVALILADAIAIVIVGFAAWILARRTLEPIRDAHQRQLRFVADASHETRNPLTAIKSTAERALSGDRTAEELRSALATIDEATDRLIRLTGDLLVLARANDPLAPVRRESVDLSVVAAEALDGIAPLMALHPSSIVAITPRFEPSLVVSGDPDELSRVVRNLLENAFRHGGPGVTVTVRTWGEAGEAHLEVGDSGRGIAVADLRHIFDPFYRVGGPRPGGDGVGLGLAIARDLAQRNAGRLEVRSVPGQGAFFRLTVPRLR